MKDYSSEKDLYKLAKNLAYKFTLDKYKTFLIQNELIKKDTLDEPFGRFSRIMVKEEYIRETLMLLWPGEKFDQLIEILYGEEIAQESSIDESGNKKESPESSKFNASTKTAPAINRKLRVFLCYASQDKLVVRELYQRLLDEGWIDPWLDEENLLPGQDWDMEIEKAVGQADAVIVCLSKSSVTKEGYIQRELRYILDIALEKPEGTIFVVPIRLEECQIPRRIKAWQYVDYFPAERKVRASIKYIQALQARFEDIKGQKKDNLIASEMHFSKIVESLSRHVDLQALLDELALQALQIIRGNYADKDLFCTIWLLEDKYILRVKSVSPKAIMTGYDIFALGVNLREKNRRGVSGLAFLQMLVLNISDVSVYYDEFISIMPGVKSQLAVPIIYEGNPIGVISLESQILNRFSASDENKISSLALIGGHAIGKIK